MRRIATSLVFAVMALAAMAATPILGKAKLSAEHLTEFIRQNNPDFPAEIAEAFIAVGNRYGIRGDIALCQAILETGWFRFTGGTAVTLDQNNFCGLGVTSLGVKGHEFRTVEEGVTAHIQHLFAYATKKKLPKGESVIDPRFGYVRRGVAPSWEKLSGRWAANPRYGRDILALYKKACDARKESKSKR